MNAIIYLKRIKKMDMKIKVAMEELAQLEALATKTSVAMGDERIQSSGSQQKMADCVVKIADAKNEINKEVEELTRCKNEAMQILSNCDEHGTSPVAAVVCLVVGVACMKWSYRKGGLRSEETNDSLVTCGLYGSKRSITGRGK